MTDLMPVDVTQAEELNEKLSGTKFRSTIDFIEFYNSGLLNKAADEVAEYADAVDTVFKNVKLQGKTLVFISKAEVELDETLAELRKWEIVVKVKDRLSKLVQENALEENDVVCFTNDAVGVLQKVEETDSGSVASKLLDEKFFKPADESLVGEIHADHSSADNENCFVVQDFTQLNLEFISQIHQVVFN